MKIKQLFVAVLATMSFALAAKPSEAHVRNYLDTYGYYTLEKGKSELEVKTDHRSPAEGDSYWTNQTEFEYGVTNHYSLGLYGVFQDGQGFTAAKVENRYRFSEHGKLPVDIAAYLEFKDANGHKDNDEIESKLILSKDVNRWNFTTNIIFAEEKEIEESGESEWESEHGILLATSYNTRQRITPGLELLLQKDESRITPGLYIDVMPSVRLNLGLGIGLVSKADDIQLKSIVEIEF